MQPGGLLADALASGGAVRVLEAWTPQPRPVHLLWRRIAGPCPKRRSLSPTWQGNA